ncbi:DoxX family protein [Chryseobacterium paridis]|uniref:DoxX family protein n=1 Tax=Chryseobacterium paridis TaxID=2800328 RepID=A0ABS1FU12_9FLAO|nr:hypothetical protein [Chryseobacterium paridis]MBK1895876.1 hypothetical protein [Chryseobacterium paridis]
MPEAVLPIVSILSLIIFKIKDREYQYAISARIAMSIMLITAGIAHFVFCKGMSLMLPDFIPYKEEIVYGTGVLEMLAAIGILIPKYQKTIGWLLIVFFILILPANILAASKGLNLKNATYDGNGINYLWYRIPLQIVFILWVYFSCIKTYIKKDLKQY